MHQFLTFLEGEGECQVPRERVWCSSRKVLYPSHMCILLPRLLAEGKKADPAYKRSHRPSPSHAGFGMTD
jgi:hypothetical protein